MILSSPTHTSIWPSLTAPSRRAAAPAGTWPVRSMALTTSVIALAELTSADTCVTSTPSIFSVPSDLTLRTPPAARVDVDLRPVCRRGCAALAGGNDPRPRLLRDGVGRVTAREPGTLAGCHEAGATVEAGHVDVHLNVDLGHLLGAAELEGAGGLLMSVFLTLGE